ncbi:hypothetical protein D9M68_655090 [compost metagenome]
MRKTRPRVLIVEEIDLYPEDFASDLDAHRIVLQIANHVALRRAELRQIPGSRSRRSSIDVQDMPLARRAFWGDLIPWFELIAEPSVLDGCARDCGMPSAELADLLADRIRPCNFQVFLWMAQTMRSRDWAQGREDFGVRLVSSIEAERTKQREGLAKGGRKSGVTRSRDAKCPAEKLMREWDDLLAEGKDERSIANLLAGRHGYSDQHVRRVRRKEEKKRTRT